MAERGAGKRLLIVGGVAGGASAAARARRLSEDSEIHVYDRGPFVSFANCGLPYYVGNVIADETKLLVASPELFERRFNIRVHVETEVMSIDRQARTVEVRDLRSGTVVVTSQNHGYAVDPDTLPPEVELTHINLNDSTLEGFAWPASRLIAVQHHPEASPGPHDSLGLFRELRELASGGNREARCVEGES